MSRIPADEVVAEYLAQAAAAACALLPAQREEFLDRLHDEVRDRVGPGPRHDAEAVSAALADLGDPRDLVTRERERLARGVGIQVRDARRLTQSQSWPTTATVPAAPDAARPSLDPEPAEDGLSAAVVRQRSVDLPTEIYPSPLHRDTRPEPLESPVAGPALRERLRGMRWELGTLAMFVAGPQVVGLLALLIGAAMVVRSTFWEIRDKVAALLGIPVLGVLLVAVRAWAESTQLNELETSATRLRAAGESLAESLQVAVPVLGLLIAAWLGWLVAREGRWSEAARHVRRSGR